MKRGLLSWLSGPSWLSGWMGRSNTPLPVAPTTRPSQNSGSYRGSLSHYRPRSVSPLGQSHERGLSQARAGDLAANDWAASSAINAIATNAVGTGLKPQSRLNAKRLGISREDALALQDAIEAIWTGWTPTAHASGGLHFEDLQFLGLRTLLKYGELLHVPVMRPQNDPTNNFAPLSLTLQDITPTRLRTPADLRYASNLYDGIELAASAQPLAYWLATPTATTGRFLDTETLTSAHFTRIPARIGHRPGCFHLFRALDDEQKRGTPVLSSGLNLFRHLADAVDHELLAQVITASMTMFIEQADTGLLPPHVQAQQDDNGEKVYHQAVEPGSILYGNKNEKPHMLEAGRPSPNFASFCELIMRAMAASVDMPYEVLSKDFSKTNYSSARAALLEAWRVFLLYRSWLVRHYCQPIFAMVVEEAWLRGLLPLPASAPDFYDAPGLYTNALWIGPSRGYVDPVKEINATITALNNRLMTYSEAIAERGRDFDEVMDEREEEETRLQRLEHQGGVGQS